MKIRQVVIHNFGQFHNKKILFSPGLNVVYGENESGKSTLHTFLVSMLFGMEKSRGRGAGKDSYSRYEPWNSSSFYSGEMDFEIEGKKFHLERNFYHRERHTEILNMQDGEVLSEEYGDLQMLLGGLTKEAYESTYCIAQTGIVPGKELAVFVQNSMADAVGTGDGSIQLDKAMQHLKNRRKTAEKEMKIELEKKRQRLEKLQMEREILEEDVERLRREKNVEETADKQEEDVLTKKKGRHLGILILGSFLAAGCFLAPVFWRASLRNAVFGGIFFCILTMLVSAAVYRMERGTAPERLYGQGKLWGREEELREKQTRLFNILEYQTELEMPAQREQELKQDIAACEIADQTIRALTGEIYEDFGSRINKRTSEILAELTRGAYERVEISEKMEMSVYAKNRICQPQQLSTGTLEQIYFALRMSLGEVLSQNEPMPFLLDETFSRYDEPRTREALRWLGRQDCQTILFTCQKREIEYLKELGIAFEKIELEGN